MKKAAKKGADGGSVVDTERYGYDRIAYTDPKTGKTRHSAGNGDAVARAMLGLNSDDLMRIVKKAGLGDKYDGKAGKAGNPGLFRMSLGHSLRALIKAGTPVQIGEHLIKKLDQKVVVSLGPATKQKPRGAAAAPRKAKTATRARRNISDQPEEREEEHEGAGE